MSAWNSEKEKRTRMTRIRSDLYSVIGAAVHKFRKPP
jgi:hypothetical protein